MTTKKQVTLSWIQIRYDNCEDSNNSKKVPEEIEEREVPEWEPLIPEKEDSELFQDPVQDPEVVSM